MLPASRRRAHRAVERRSALQRVRPSLGRARHFARPGSNRIAHKSGPRFVSNDSGRSVARRNGSKRTATWRRLYRAKNWRFWMKLSRRAAACRVRWRNCKPFCRSCKRGGNGKKRCFCGWTATTIWATKTKWNCGRRTSHISSALGTVGKRYCARHGDDWKVTLDPLRLGRGGAASPSNQHE